MRHYGRSALSTAGINFPSLQRNILFWSLLLGFNYLHGSTIPELAGFRDTFRMMILKHYQYLTTYQAPEAVYNVYDCIRIYQRSIPMICAPPPIGVGWPFSSYQSLDSCYSELMTSTDPYIAYLRVTINIWRQYGPPNYLDWPLVSGEHHAFVFYDLASSTSQLRFFGDNYDWYFAEEFEERIPALFAMEGAEEWSGFTLYSTCGCFDDFTFLPITDGFRSLNQMNCSSHPSLYL